MAKAVYESEDIVLMGGQEVTLRPLNIKGIRKFNNKLRELRAVAAPEGIDDPAEIAAAVEDATLEKMIDLCAICLERDLKELTEDRDKFEESLDLDTMYEILKKVGGLDLVGQNAALLAQLAAE